MQMLHPKIIEILAGKPSPDNKYLVLAWTDIFLWRLSGVRHAKMFITEDRWLGIYLRILYNRASRSGLRLDKNKVLMLDRRVAKAFSLKENERNTDNLINIYFGEFSVFSDASALYYRGINLFPDLFGGAWHRYVPKKSLTKIKKLIKKTLK